MKLQNKVALITGAGGGVGRATALCFANEGAKVAVVDIAVGPGEETVTLIKEAGGEALFIQGDVSSSDDTKRMVQATVETFGRLDTLYNNAAILVIAETIAHTSEADWDRLMNVNLKSIFLLSKNAIPVMIEQGGGTIINTASVSGPMVGHPTLAAYAATKSGVVGLTRSMALELISQNIRVNCICPSVVETQLFPKVFLGEGGTQEELEAGQKDFASILPMQRFAQPDEIARTVLFLASDDAAYVNGVALAVDGGHSIQ